MTTVEANPYPWPYDGCIDGARLALVITGAQRGILALCPDPSRTRAVIGALTAAVREVDGLVVWVRHGTSGARRPQALPQIGSGQWELAEATRPTDVTVDAGGWDGTYNSSLDHELRRLGRTHVLLGGYAAELTVDSTVRTLNDRGYECLVVTDAGAPIDAELARRAHSSITMSGGIFGAVATSSALFAALHSLSTKGTQQ
jgi:nicotinamidase-related amidase